MFIWVLESRTTSLKYVRFDDLQQFETDKIIEIIEHDLPPIVSHTIFSTRMEQCLYPDKSVEEWDKNDISQWFQHNEIRTELEDLCRFKDGYELLNYAKIFLNTKELQYKMYSDEFLRVDGITFGKKPLFLHEFTKFLNALRQLEQFSTI